MEPYKEATEGIRKYNINLVWSVSDHWFRILEFSFILGVLNYFKNKTNNVLMEIIYWASWVFVFWIVLEVAEFIAQKFSKNKTLKMRWLVWVISFAALFILFFTITSATNSITENQFILK